MARCSDCELSDLVRSGEARRLRRASGISYGAMAAGLGISTGQVWDLENGRYTPRPGLGAKYVQVLRGLQHHDEVTRELAGEQEAA